MTLNEGKRVRVVLRWIQIKDALEPFFKEHGEFRFRSRVSSGGTVREEHVPEEGHWTISDHPRFNKVDEIDRVLFDGPAGDRLVVELFGEELDSLSANDPLDPYRREFYGSAEEWAGLYTPGDEGRGDPENLALWRVGYEVTVERAGHDPSNSR